jgi:TolB protein
MPSPSGAVEYNLSLYALPVGGGTRQQLYADNEAHVGPMAYAPGGRWLVFTRSGFSTNSSQQLYRLALNTEQAAPYPGAPTRSYDPAFSPDGRWLAFAARDNDQTDIWVLPGTAPPGSSPNPQRLTSMGMARAPAFSPDGRLLAFLAIPPDEQGFELWVSELSQPVDGVLQASDPRQLTSEMGLDADSGLSWAR